jgi:hypothetical protein
MSWLMMWTVAPSNINIAIENVMPELSGSDRIESLNVMRVESYCPRPMLRNSSRITANNR